MIIKKIEFGSSAQEKLVNGVTVLSRAVKSTLGARGRYVLIESQYHEGGMTATKDGATVAQAINLECPFEDLASNTVKEAAKSTATIAGDGTTTSIVLAEAFINETIKRTTEENNLTEVTRNITKITEDIITRLDEKSVKVEGRTIYNVATTSANNDPAIGNIIGAAYEEVGNNGIVLVKDSKGEGITSDITTGIKFDRGYTSSNYMTNDKTRKCELKDPYILITDRKVESLMDIINLMEAVVNSKKPLLIIGELGMEAQATFLKNIQNGSLKGANVIPPGFGYYKDEMLEDLAIATGGTFVSEKAGDDWNLVTMSQLGKAESISIDKDSTTIIVSGDNELADERIENLKSQLDEAKTEEEKGILRRRIANMCGKVATIHVGGTTPNERKEKKDRVDDAVLATKAAMEEGILPGGGIALLETMPIKIENAERDMVVAADIVTAAISVPFEQILINAGKDVDDIRDQLTIGNNNGYNVKTEEFGDMYKMGIIDPAKVTKTALRQAVSVAITILMTDTVITNARQTS